MKFKGRPSKKNYHILGHCPKLARSLPLIGIVGNWDEIFFSDPPPPPGNWDKKYFLLVPPPDIVWGGPCGAKKPFFPLLHFQALFEEPTNCSE